MAFAALPLLLLAQQSQPPPRRPGPPIPEQWWSGSFAGKLKCSSQKYPAVLGFDFRYWTGLDFVIDLKQFLPLDRGRRIYVLFRVTPQGREPRFFMQRQFIPPVLNLPPNTKLKDVQITVGGGVHLGVGKYRIDALAADQDGRACRESWSVEAKPMAEPLRQEPYTVETPPPARQRAPGEARQRVAIVANVDTFGPRRFGGRLSTRDRSTLADSIQSLADTWDTADFSLHLVDVERRKVLLTEPHLTRASFDKVDQALRSVDGLTVDIDSLKRGARGDFVAQLVERNLAEWASYDAVVFLGPAWRWFDRLPDSARKKFRELPKLYYLAMIPFRFFPQNLVKQFVDAQDGQVFAIHVPTDLARAIKKIRLH